MGISDEGILGAGTPVVIVHIVHLHPLHRVKYETHDRGGSLILGGNLRLWPIKPSPHLHR